MKYLKYFLLFVLQFALVEFVIWFHASRSNWDISLLSPSDAISLWGTVTTIVFLVFSVLALWNIDQKIHELNDLKRDISEKFTSIETKNREVMLEADKAQKDIVKEAEVQIKKILDKSTYRQNFYDTLTKIANNPDCGIRVLEYTNFLRTSGNVEGVNYAYVYICRGDAYMNLKRFDKALADYEMAAKIDTKTIDPLMALGGYYVAIKEYAKSIELYTQGLKISPQNEKLMMNIANSYSSLGDYDKADEYYDKALTYNPDLAVAYYNKAKLEIEKKGKLWKETAMNYLNHSLEIIPCFCPSNINKAGLLKESEKYEEAAEVLTKVIETALPQDFVMSILQRGIIYRKLRKMPQALNDFNVVLWLQPHNVQNLCNLASVNLSMGNLDEAMHFSKLGLAEAQKQHKHDCDAEFNLVVDNIKSASSCVLES